MSDEPQPSAVVRVAKGVWRRMMIFFRWYYEGG